MLRNSIWFVIFLSSKNHFKSKLFNKTCSRLKQALKPYLNGENYREYKDSSFISFCKFMKVGNLADFSRIQLEFMRQLYGLDGNQCSKCPFCGMLVWQLTEPLREHVKSEIDLPFALTTEFSQQIAIQASNWVSEPSEPSLGNINDAENDLMPNNAGSGIAHRILFNQFDHIKA